VEINAARGLLADVAVLSRLDPTLGEIVDSEKDRKAMTMRSTAAQMFLIFVIDFSGAGRAK
jgi:hypothetical protein